MAVANRIPTSRFKATIGTPEATTGAGKNQRHQHLNDNLENSIERPSVGSHPDHYRLYLSNEQAKTVLMDGVLITWESKSSAW